MNDRRLGIETDTNHARRKGDKVFSVILGLLLVFLLNWIFGCSAASRESESSRFPAVDCRKHPQAFRCQPYVPEKEFGDSDWLEKVNFEADF